MKARSADGVLVTIIVAGAEDWDPSQPAIAMLVDEERDRTRYGLYFLSLQLRKCKCFKIFTKATKIIPRVMYKGKTQLLLRNDLFSELLIV